MGMGISTILDSDLLRRLRRVRTAPRESIEFIDRVHLYVGVATAQSATVIRVLPPISPDKLEGYHHVLLPAYIHGD